jgi:protein gp37
MGEKTNIPWCHHTFNPWWGCTKVSAGCANCYADAWAKRTGFDVFGQDKPRRFFGDKHWAEPIAWDAAANAAGERRRVFCGSMCDVFESDGLEPSGADERDYARDALWHLINGTPRLDWLLLTKRPQYIEAMVPSEWYNPDWVAENCRRWSTDDVEVVPDRPLGWPANAWLGITVENQEALARCDGLLRCPAPVRFLSCEPLLGRLRFANFDGIHWVIIGCEKLLGNRPGRPCPHDLMRDLIVQAHTAGVKVFVKQVEIDGRVSANPDDWPKDLRIQEFPTSCELTPST